MTSRVCLLVQTSIKDILTRPPIFQCVRFRKPFWLPVAKSKEFYVRKPTPIDQEEYEELKHRYRTYRSEVESLRQFLRKQLSRKEVSVIQQQVIDDEADFKVMMEQVEEWNRNVSFLRSERQAHEELLHEQHLQALMQEREQEKMKKAAEAMAALHKSKDISKGFIQADSLDDAIEKLLDSRSDYNYAITKSGDKLPGEYPDRPEGLGPGTKKANHSG